MQTLPAARILQETHLALSQQQQFIASQQLRVYANPLGFVNMILTIQATEDLTMNFMDIVISGCFVNLIWHLRRIQCFVPGE